jgi:hypothetical protein
MLAFGKISTEVYPDGGISIGNKTREMRETTGL